MLYELTSAVSELSRFCFANREPFEDTFNCLLAFIKVAIQQIVDMRRDHADQLSLGIVQIVQCRCDAHFNPALVISPFILK